MKLNTFRHTLIRALILNMIIFVINLAAQHSGSDYAQVKYLYDELRFEEAIQSGHKMLSANEYLSATHLEYIHQYMAFSYYNIGSSDSARVHFLALLSINPEYELDPLTTSPKIIDFFTQTKTDFQDIDARQNILPYPKYIFIEDPRPSAAWRSAILPGWGQYYKMQPSRAYIFGGSFITSAIVLGISVANENNYRDSYRTSTDPEEISGYYEKYNNWSKVRKISTYTTVGIWLLSFADALWSDYPQIEITPSQSQNSVIISVTHKL